VHASGGLAGRGEGTWNPVAASWMYRVAVEGLLGLRIEQGRLLRVAPCIPDEWPGLRVRYRLPDAKTILDIEIDNSAGCASRVVSATVDNHAVSVDRAGARIVLRRDGKLHRVKVTLG
jgi:N,N'-diacetylchitobiose phosphorylase